MTRTRAGVLSMFGPLLPAILLMSVFSVFDDPPRVVAILGLTLCILAALTMRIYFAIWYVRDKGRNPVMGLMALFGLLGWLLLIVTEDRNTQRATPIAMNAAETPALP